MTKCLMMIQEHGDVNVPTQIWELPGISNACCWQWRNPIRIGKKIRNLCGWGSSIRHTNSSRHSITVVHEAVKSAFTWVGKSTLSCECEVLLCKLLRTTNWMIITVILTCLGGGLVTGNAEACFRRGWLDWLLNLLQSKMWCWKLLACLLIYCTLHVLWGWKTQVWL